MNQPEDYNLGDSLSESSEECSEGNRWSGYIYVYMLKEQRVQWLDGAADSMALSLSNLQETVKDRGAWHVAVHEVA